MGVGSISVSSFVFCLGRTLTHECTSLWQLIYVWVGWGILQRIVWFSMLLTTFYTHAHTYMHACMCVYVWVYVCVQHLCMSVCFSKGISFSSDIKGCHTCILTSPENVIAMHSDFTRKHFYAFWLHQQTLLCILTSPADTAMHSDITRKHCYYWNAMQCSDFTRKHCYAFWQAPTQAPYVS